MHRYVVAALTEPRDDVSRTAPDVDYVPRLQSGGDQARQSLGAEIRAARSCERDLLMLEIGNDVCVLHVGPGQPKMVTRRLAPEKLTIRRISLGHAPRRAASAGLGVVALW